MAKSAVKKPAARSVGSLLKLLEQINYYAPKRSKVSDGWVGDARHAAGHSDHNAEPDGTVDARDFTNDPSGGMDSQKLCDALVASKDPRISYLICNGKIIAGRKGPKPWTPRKYTGSNGHYHHIHVSVLDEGQDDKTPWKIESAFKKSSPVPKTEIPKLTTKQVSSVMHLGSKGEFVEQLQKDLNTLGYGPLRVTGNFGVETEDEVKRFQKDAKLDKIDGWAGPQTVGAISKELEKRKTAPKLDAASAVVSSAANDGKVSPTEWLSAAVGTGGTVSVVKEISDSLTSTTQSIGSLITSLGPWVLLGIVVIGGAGYIYYERRKKRIEAQAVQKVL